MLRRTSFGEPVTKSSQQRGTLDNVGSLWWTLSDLYVGGGNVWSCFVGLPGSKRCLGGESEKFLETRFGSLYVLPADGGNFSKMRRRGGMFFCWTGQTSVASEKRGGAWRLSHPPECTSSTDFDVQGWIFKGYYCSNCGSNPRSRYSTMGCSQSGGLETELGWCCVLETSHN